MIVLPQNPDDASPSSAAQIDWLSAPGRARSSRRWIRPPTRCSNKRRRARRPARPRSSTERPRRCTRPLTRTCPSPTQRPSWYLGRASPASACTARACGRSTLRSSADREPFPQLMAPRAVHPSLGSRTPPTGAEAGAIVAELRDLNVVYEGREQPLRAVRDVNLEVRRGEIIALVGESGSGKSSVSMALLGLIPASEATITGSATVLGVDMATAPAAQRMAVRKTSHRRGVPGPDELAQPDDDGRPPARGGRRLAERAERAAQAVGVPDAAAAAAELPPRALGRPAPTGDDRDGDRPRSALVVADEPTTALDVTIQAQILDLIRRAARRGRLRFLLITHDLGVAAAGRRPDRCLLRRTIRRDGSRPRRCSARPRHPYAMGSCARASS